MTEKIVLYFGCRDGIGHYLQTESATIWGVPHGIGFPWNLGHLDGGLLKNGNHPDVYDGRVFWTCGGTPLWLAFFWWDNSVDHRSGSNSGFYIRGFDVVGRQVALDYAGTVFPKVVARQRYPLALQP